MIKPSHLLSHNTKKNFFRKPKHRPKYETISIPDESCVHRVDRWNALTTTKLPKQKDKKFQICKIHFRMWFHWYAPVPETNVKNAQKIFINTKAEFFLSSPYNYRVYRRESLRSEKSTNLNPPRRYWIWADFVTYTPVWTGINTWGIEGKPKAEQSWARHALLGTGSRGIHFADNKREVF